VEQLDLISSAQCTEEVENLTHHVVTWSRRSKMGFPAFIS
jgi:hypothetical protein